MLLGFGFFLGVSKYNLGEEQTIDTLHSVRVHSHWQ